MPRSVTTCSAASADGRPGARPQARPSSTTRAAHLRAAALGALPPADAARVAWTDARFPAILDPGPLRGLVRSLGLSRTRLLSDDSPPTLLERSGGNWEKIMAGLGAGPGGSVADMAAAFRTHVSPSAAAPSTRSKDWAGWRAVLAWATARKALGKVLPMQRPTLEALIWEMLACQCTAPIIKGAIDAIQARHRRFALPSPIVGPRAYSRLTQSLTRFQGTQSPYKSPITPALVKAMLYARSSTPAEERNILAACAATVNGLRPAEGADLQACDLRFEFDLRHGPQYRGTAAINVMKRKQDQDRKGHHPRTGRGSRPATDVVGRLRSFMASLGTTPGPGFTKAARPHARCPVCAPLFPILLPGGAPRRAAASPHRLLGHDPQGAEAGGRRHPRLLRHLRPPGMHLDRRRGRRSRGYPLAPKRARPKPLRPLLRQAHKA